MLPVQISVRNLRLAPDMEADIRERAAALLTYYDRVVNCHVTVEVPTRRHRSGVLHKVRVDLTVPGGVIVVRRRPHEDWRTSVQIAFNAARRRLQDYARRKRGAVKVHARQPDIGMEVPFAEEPAEHGPYAPTVVLHGDHEPAGKGGSYGA
jgi:ribosome-associated translation inhibitor RaiA